MASNVAATWQHKMDREFPSGAVCSWQELAAGTPVIYVTPRIQVLGAVGLDPVIKIVPIDNSRVLGPAQITSYTPVTSGAWPAGTVRVTFAEYPGEMFWHPKVPAVLAARMPEGEQQ